MNLLGKAMHRHSAFMPLVVCFASCSLVAGCGSKDAAPTVAAPTSLKGQAPASVPVGDVKGTPEQEAAKQKAIQDGPAIEAALKAQQQGQPATK